MTSPAGRHHRSEFDRRGSADMRGLLPGRTRLTQIGRGAQGTFRLICCRARRLAGSGLAGSPELPIASKIIKDSTAAGYLPDLPREGPANLGSNSVTTEVGARR